jgi:hypothetical protein
MLKGFERLSKEIQGTLLNCYIAAENYQEDGYFAQLDFIMMPIYSQ